MENIEILKLSKENKRLKREYDILDGIIEINNMRIEQLKKENERLKKENEQLKETNLQLQTIDMEIDRNNKYRKALEEIREYIQSLNKDICNNCGWHNTDGCSPNSYVCHDLIEIQSKINEVL